MRIAMTGVRGVPALYSGFETAVTEIGARLVQRGHDVVVYCRNGYGDASEPEYQGIRKVYLPRIDVKVADTLSHTLFSLLHHVLHPADVLLVFNPANGPLCMIPRLQGVPFAVNVDGLEWKRAKWPYLGQRYFYFASWFCTKIAPEIIADSMGIQRYYREQWHRDSYFAAYGAYLETSSAPEMLDEFGLTPRGYFVVVARLEPENNTDLIIEAFARLKTDKQLVIVGGVNYESAYHQRLRALESDRVRFLGGVYDQAKLTEIVCNSFAYVHGHMVGGTNPMLLKALGCGACVLYLDVDFNAEVVGAAGIPFPKDAEGAAQVFEALLAEPERADALREAAPQRIVAEYTWDAITDRYEALCMRLHESKARKKGAR